MQPRMQVNSVLTGQPLQGIRDTPETSTFSSGFNVYKLQHKSLNAQGFDASKIGQLKLQSKTFHNARDVVTVISKPANISQPEEGLSKVLFPPKRHQLTNTCLDFRPSDELKQSKFRTAKNSHY